MFARTITTILFVCIVCLTLPADAQKPSPTKTDKKLLRTIKKNFRAGAEQYRVMMNNVPADSFPRSYKPATGKFISSTSDWWCSGFYPGTLLYLYEQKKDEKLYNEATRMLGLLEKEKYNTTTHDLGFMMYCSFGNANRIAPKPAYNEILLTSAKSLATRFDSTVGAIKSWEGKANEYLVIIDNMMNLKLLFWATRQSGDSSFYKIAVTHANTTIKNHFRPDHSSYHVLNYNKTTGQVQQKKTAQGFADESAWARGQAWGLYGFTEVYRETKNETYLDQANHIAQFILNHPNLPADKIPYWDFNAPDIPDALRDVSAGAIMASALLELSQYVDDALANTYFNAAQTILVSLSSPKYMAAPGSNHGFILEHSVGHLPQDSEVDVPLTYADYYFVEAMKRYKEYKR